MRQHNINMSPRRKSVSVYLYPNPYSLTALIQSPRLTNNATSLRNAIQLRQCLPNMLRAGNRTPRDHLRKRRVSPMHELHNQRYDRDDMLSRVGQSCSGNSRAWCACRDCKGTDRCSQRPERRYYQISGTWCWKYWKQPRILQL